MKRYEIFIAYRRRETKEIAERIYNALLKRGYETFLDIHELGSGNYRYKNLPEIASNTVNYIVIISKTTFERCFTDNDDLFAKGIEFALINNKNIIPVFTNNILSFPDVLPNNITDIKNYNGLIYDDLHFDEFIERLIHKFLVDKNAVIVSNASQDFYLRDDILIEYVGEASKVIVPNTVHVIAEGAFKDRTKVEEIILPEGLIEIKDRAFERCIKLLSISIPDSVKRIGEKAFTRCYNMVYIKLGNGLEEIDEYAFLYCCKLKWILLPRSLKTVSGSSFNGCSMLNAIFVEEGNQFLASKDGILYDQSMKSLIRCPENFEEDYIELAGSVKEIKSYAFYRCLNIQQINLPRRLQEIGEYAFEGCCNVASITLSDSIKEFSITAIEGWNFNQIHFSKKFSPVKKREIEEQLRSKKQIQLKDRNYEFLIIKTTFESIEEAKNMADMLLRFKYIVSGQIHQIESLYLWDQKINDEIEYELTCITLSSKCDYAVDFIVNNHSFDNCQILVIPVREVSSEIANWIHDSLEGDS